MLSEAKLVIAIGLACLIVVLWRWGRQPTANPLSTPDAVLRVFQFLLTNGTRRATLIIRPRRASSPAMTFFKYVRPNGQLGFVGQYREVSGSEDAWGRLCEELNQRGIPHSIVTDDGQRAARWDFGTDV